ncbi:MAG: hypothetical protein JNK90_20860 [Planctomycetaceae bacterium]|nr:hypothetical protein [Planctomycetaceae bacterium]
MTSNPILDEIHAIREKLLAEHAGDLHAYVESARKRALESGRPIYQPKQRTKDRTEPDGQPRAGEGSVSSAQ